jgi:uncharacterized protein (DUF2249 family)/quercetin dioxygenase-like cupin family protein
MNDSAAAPQPVTIAGSADELIRLLPAASGGVASKRILKAPGFGLVRLTFDADQAMSEHEAAVPILIQVISGAIDIEIDRATQRVHAGGMLYVAAHVRHALHAPARADVLLTLADAATRAPSDRAGVGETEVGRNAAGRAPDAAFALEQDGDGADRAHAPSPEHRPLLGTSACECGVVDGAAFPELDVREVPHSIRHATVFGALDSLRPRDGLVLIASHDPLPLLAQITQRTGDRFAVTYLERGPEAWSVQFVHTGGDDAAR